MFDTMTTDSAAAADIARRDASTPGRWQFQVEVSDTLPPRAWLARVHPGHVEAIVGGSVRVEGDGIFEGTWAGAAGLASVIDAATVFGSGIVVAGGRLYVVPPAHTLEPIYHAPASDGGLVITNTFPGLLEALAAELRTDIAYPLLFGRINRGLSHLATEIPTSGPRVTVHYFENLVVSPSAVLSVVPKAREPDFATFAEYHELLVTRLVSAFANAPAHSPLATLSSGYDSTAGAAVGAQAGCRHAVTFSSGWPWQGFAGTTDSGEKAARALGLELRTFDRLGYTTLLDAPEAEFLATGLSGEDVVYRSMESALPRSILLTGFWGGAAWRNHDRAELSRLDLSGASLGELRLRTDFIHLPVAFIGGSNQPSLRRIRASPEMRPFTVGGRYDEPVARRLAEEGGVPRGAFAVNKMATSVLFHAEGLAAMSASGRASFESFCDVQAPGVLGRLPHRGPIGRRGRIALRLAHALRADRLTGDIARRRLESVHIEPVLGSLLLRWSVSLLRDRYRAARGFANGRE